LIKRGTKNTLDNDEKIIHAISGQYEIKIMGTNSMRAGILLSTNKGIVFYAKN